MLVTLSYQARRSCPSGKQIWLKPGMRMRAQQHQSVSGGILRYLFLVGLPHLAYSGGLYEVWELEGRLLQAPLPLQVFPLLTPMPRHRHCISVRLHRLGQSGSVKPSVMLQPANATLAPCLIAPRTAERRFLLFRDISKATRA